MSDSKISSYGKVWSYDDAPVRAMFPSGCIVDIEEKIDGSQFSCALIGGELHFRSKGVPVYREAAGMFERACAECAAIQERWGFAEGCEYRFEYLMRPKHNTLAYGRVPKGNLVLLDVMSASGEFLPVIEVTKLAINMGIEAVNLVHHGPLPTREEMDKMADFDSCLGGCKAEGIVIKARNLRHTQDGKMLKAKVVNGWFKERNSKEWRKSNPTAGDIVQEIATELRTDARFEKSIQAMRDDGEYTGTTRDIGPFLKRLGTDLHDEHFDYVKERLAKHFWSKIQRAANAGAPEYFKKHLAEAAETCQT